MYFRVKCILYNRYYKQQEDDRRSVYPMTWLLLINKDHCPKFTRFVQIDSMPLNSSGGFCCVARHLAIMLAELPLAYLYSLMQDRILSRR